MIEFLTGFAFFVLCFFLIAFVKLTRGLAKLTIDILTDKQPGNKKLAMFFVFLFVCNFAYTCFVLGGG